MQQIPQQNIDAPDPQRHETVLVTGGSGYIAGWIIVQLLEQGYRVRTTVRSQSREAAVRNAVSGQVNPEGRLSFAVADLLTDDGWSGAVDGCRYVIHVASPMGQGEPKADLLRPAREGTIRLLKAARDAGVERVVLTSSTVAAKSLPKHGEAPSAATNESTWTDPEEKGLSSYARSKTLAERAAWEYAGQITGTPELTTILPGMVSRARDDRQDLGLGRAHLPHADRKGARSSKDRLQHCRCARSGRSTHTSHACSGSCRAALSGSGATFFGWRKWQNSCGTSLASRPQKCLPAVFRTSFFVLRPRFRTKLALWLQCLDNARSSTSAKRLPC